MIRILVVSLFSLVCLQVPAAAQSTATPACPEIGIEGPKAGVFPGEAVDFQVRADRNATDRLRFRWSVSGGRIAISESTRSITLDTTGLSDGKIIVTVTIDGLPTGCLNMLYSEMSVEGCGLVFPRKFGGYARGPWEAEIIVLKHFAIEATRDPTEKLVIISYGGRHSYEQEALRRAQRAKDHLVASHAIDANRIEIVDGGYHEEALLEFWVVPGAAPMPEPRSTILSAEVIFDGKPQ